MIVIEDGAPMRKQVKAHECFSFGNYTNVWQRRQLQQLLLSEPVRTRAPPQGRAPAKRPLRTGNKDAGHR